MERIWENTVLMLFRNPFEEQWDQDFLQAAKAVDIQIEEDVVYEEIVLLLKVVDSTKKKSLICQSIWNGLKFYQGEGFRRAAETWWGNSIHHNKNRMREELVKTKLFTKFNFNMTCELFENFLRRGPKFASPKIPTWKIKLLKI